MIDQQQILIKGYDDTAFLAEKLRKVFSQIKTDGDRALHNDMMLDVQMMVGQHAEELRRRVAEVIINLGQRNYAQRNTKEKEVSAAAQRLG